MKAVGFFSIFEVVEAWPLAGSLEMWRWVEMLASSWWSVIPGPVDLEISSYWTPEMGSRYSLLEGRRESNSAPPHVRLRHVDRVDGGESLGPEQLKRLLSRDVLQLCLYFGLVLLVHCHRLFEDRSRLSDRGNQVVFRVASLVKKSIIWEWLFTLIESSIKWFTCIVRLGVILFFGTLVFVSDQWLSMMRMAPGPFFVWMIQTHSCSRNISSWLFWKYFPWKFSTISRARRDADTDWQ